MEGGGGGSTLVGEEVEVLLRDSHEHGGYLDDDWFNLSITV